MKINSGVVHSPWRSSCGPSPWCLLPCCCELLRKVHNARCGRVCTRYINAASDNDFLIAGIKLDAFSYLERFTVPCKYCAPSGVSFLFISSYMCAIVLFTTLLLLANNLRAFARFNRSYVAEHIGQTNRKRTPVWTLFVFGSRRGLRK